MSDRAASTEDASTHDLFTPASNPSETDAPPLDLVFYDVSAVHEGPVSAEELAEAARSLCEMAETPVLPDRYLKAIREAKPYDVIKIPADLDARRPSDRHAEYICIDAETNERTGYEPSPFPGDGSHWFDWSFPMHKLTDDNWKHVPYLRAKCGDLNTHLQSVADEHAPAEYIRWSGLANRWDEDDPLPGVTCVVAHVRRHWHDCNPMIQLFGMKEKGREEVPVYLWGIVYDSNGVDDWEPAYKLAAKLTENLCPSSSDRGAMNGHLKFRAK